jgi:hypothetical protein
MMRALAVPASQPFDQQRLVFSFKKIYLVDFYQEEYSIEG